MATELEKRVADFVRDNQLFADGRGVVAAVSGGADSTALLTALARLAQKGVIGGRVLCAHLHHGLRGAEADADETFTAELSHKLGVEFQSRRIDVTGYAAAQKLSIETAGRQLRIAALSEIAALAGCSHVATGHHKDDNAETIAQRIARGTAYRGLCGIRPTTRFGGINFTRPLLCCRRTEIEDYLRANAIAWRTDRTNTDCGFRRNFIRHRLMPELAKQADDDIVERLHELSQAAASLQNAVDSRTQNIWDTAVELDDDSASVDAAEFAGQSPLVKVEIVRRALVALGGGQRDLTGEHYGRVVELARDGAGGGKVELPGGFQAIREYGRLLLLRRAIEEPTADAATVELPLGRQIRFGGFVIEARLLDASRADIDEFRRRKDRWIEWFDAEAISGPVIVRRRRAGDRFEPLGLGAPKKVGKFLTDEKTPAAERRDVLVFADDEKILWLCPLRMSEATKVTASTKRILQIRVRRN